MKKQIVLVVGMLVAGLSREARGAKINARGGVGHLPPAMFVIEPRAGSNRPNLIHSLFFDPANPDGLPQLPAAQFQSAAAELSSQGPVIAIRAAGQVAVMPQELKAGAKAAIIPMDGQEKMRTAVLTGEIASRIQKHLAEGNIGLAHEALSRYFDSGRAQGDAISVATPGPDGASSASVGKASSGGAPAASSGRRSPPGYFSKFEPTFIESNYGVILMLGSMPGRGKWHESVAVSWDNRPGSRSRGRIFIGSMRGIFGVGSLGRSASDAEKKELHGALKRFSDGSRKRRSKLYDVMLEKLAEENKDAMEDFSRFQPGQGMIRKVKKGDDDDGIVMRGYFGRSERVSIRYDGTPGSPTRGRIFARVSPWDQPKAGGRGRMMGLGELEGLEKALDRYIKGHPKAAEEELLYGIMNQNVSWALLVARLERFKIENSAAMTELPGVKSVSVEIGLAGHLQHSRLIIGIDAHAGWVIRGLVEKFPTLKSMPAAYEAADLPPARRVEKPSREEEEEIQKIITRYGEELRKVEGVTAVALQYGYDQDKVPPALVVFLDRAVVPGLAIEKIAGKFPELKRRRVIYRISVPVIAGERATIPDATFIKDAKESYEAAVYKRGDTSLARRMRRSELPAGAREEYDRYVKLARQYGGKPLAYRYDSGQLGNSFIWVSGPEGKKESSVSLYADSGETLAEGRVDFKGLSWTDARFEREALAEDSPLRKRAEALDSKLGAESIMGGSVGALSGRLKLSERPSPGRLEAAAARLLREIYKDSRDGQLKDEVGARLLPYDEAVRKAAENLAQGLFYGPSDAAGDRSLRRKVARLLAHLGGPKEILSVSTYSQAVSNGSSEDPLKLGLVIFVNRRTGDYVAFFSREGTG